MRFNGKNLDRNSNLSREVCLIPRYNSEPLQLTVVALPLTFNQLVLKFLPEEEPPKKLMKNSTNTGLYLGPDRKPIQYSDFEDPKFKELNFKRSQRLNAWIVFESLKFENKLEWASSPPEKWNRENVFKFLDDLNSELEEAGFSSGDLNLIIETSMKLSNMTIEEVENERDNFLSKRPVK